MENYFISPKILKEVLLKEKEVSKIKLIPRVSYKRDSYGIKIIITNKERK